VTDSVFVRQEQHATPTHVLMPKGVAWVVLGAFFLALLLAAGILAFCAIILYQQKANYTAAWVREADYQKKQEAVNGELQEGLAQALDAVRILRAEMIAAGQLPPPPDLTMRWPPKQQDAARDARRSDTGN